jgi:hypothetical protein
MCVIEFDPVEVWEEHRRKARKHHRCACCGAPVRPGDYYRTIFAVGEDGMLFEKSCEACGAARDAFAEAHDGSSPNPTSFIQVLNECIAEGDRESEAQWQPMLQGIAARRKAMA